MKLNDIVLIEAPESQGAFKALFIIGPPGSGKSSVRRSINLPSDTQFIDYDHHQTRQAKQHGFDETNPTHQQQMNKSVRRFIEDDVISGINNCNPLLVDTVGANEDELLRRINTLKNVGYDVAVIIVDVSEETSLSRAKSREDKEGRHVDPEYIKSVHANKHFSYGRIQSEIPEAVIIKNDDGDSTGIRRASIVASKFFNTPILNSKGRKIQKEMIANDAKTIAPTVISIQDFFRILASSWYKA